MMTLASPAFAQNGAQDGLRDRPIGEVRFVGLERVEEQLVRNTVRSGPGLAYDPATVQADVARLNRLGEFKHVDVTASLRDDGSVALEYEFEEQPIISEIVIRGNKLLSDQELRRAVRLSRGLPVDDFQIERSRRNIIEAYQERGNYLATVNVDQRELQETGILIFNIIEGPRVKVKVIEFEGNEAFDDGELRSQIDTTTAVFLLRKGVLDEERLEQDVASLRTFYADRGYIDARVGRRIELSPDAREAKATFYIEEGPQYTLGEVLAERTDGEALQVFAPEQLLAIMAIYPGDVYSQDKIRRSLQEIRESYGLMGYFNADVSAVPERIGPEPVINLRLLIDEGRYTKIGLLNIGGNFLTRDKVIRREAHGLKPGRPLDATQVQQTEERLRERQLFGEPIRITVQEPTSPDAEYRDVLIEVKETNTGSVTFGVAAGTDSGVFGELVVNQRNFDITDTPESVGELITGRAFRGGGQRFGMRFRPGNEIFEYSLSLTEPNLMDTDYTGTIAGGFQRRIFRLFDRERLIGDVGVGRRFGDIWNGSVNARFENVRLENIDEDAPTELFRDEGPDNLTGLGLSLTRTTITSYRRPRRGSRFELGYERVGALGGSFDFNRLSAEHTIYFMLDEDFLGRPTTLRFDTNLGYIFGGGRAPTYERFYLGGRSFRGFGFREVSPKGIRNDTGEPSDEPIGGNWMFSFGVQYEAPLFEDAISYVLFTDTGTVLDDVGFEDYRASVGAGIRLRLPQFGPNPIALDVAVPLLKEDGDDEQVVSFSVEVPF